MTYIKRIIRRLKYRLKFMFYKPKEGKRFIYEE